MKTFLAFAVVGCSAEHMLEQDLNGRHTRMETDGEIADSPNKVASALQVGTDEVRLALEKKTVKPLSTGTIAESSSISDADIAVDKLQATSLLQEEAASRLSKAAELVIPEPRGETSAVSSKSILQQESDPLKLSQEETNFGEASWGDQSQAESRFKLYVSNVQGFKNQEKKRLFNLYISAVQKLKLMGALMTPDLILLNHKYKDWADFGRAHELKQEEWIDFKISPITVYSAPVNYIRNDGNAIRKQTYSGQIVQQFNYDSSIVSTHNLCNFISQARLFKATTGFRYNHNKDQRDVVGWDENGERSDSLFPHAKHGNYWMSWNSHSYATLKKERLNDRFAQCKVVVERYQAIAQLQLSQEEQDMLN